MGNRRGRGTAPAQRRKPRTSLRLRTRKLADGGGEESVGKGADRRVDAIRPRAGAGRGASQRPVLGGSAARSVGASSSVRPRSPPSPHPPALFSLFRPLLRSSRPYRVPAPAPRALAPAEAAGCVPGEAEWPLSPGALPLRSLAAERKLAGRWPPAALSRPRLAAHRAGGEGGGEGRGGPAQGRIRRDGRHRRGGPVPLKARDGADLWPPWLRSFVDGDSECKCKDDVSVDGGFG
ncbi:hypothetical protein J1605_010956 [Eschrichtius robustus]|uniref:Uncharacterized protein n=1 Tax=Eschrichtius robustus TaxID=9764 RepID=A0AB34GNR0_ESCRO|nr:hypothetical protein J1605_010956 [Eschrichtius robustus]